MGQWWVGVVLLALAVAGSGCSVRHFAANQAGHALAGTGSTFASDDDPDFVKAAVPFGLKVMEGLLIEVPDHQALRTAAAGGFAQYAFAFIQLDADELEGQDFAKAEALRGRARRMYLRARNLGLAGLELAHPGFTNRLAASPQAAVRSCGRPELPLLYWTAAAWGGAVSLSKDDPQIIGQVPQMEALIDRAVELDEAWNEGALHGVLIAYEMSRQGVPGDAAARARVQFDRAVELSGGRQAAPYVTFAEAVCVKTQNVAEFDRMLAAALAIDPDATPDHRLANLIYQRRARWLQGQRDQLFLIPDEKPKS